MRSRPVHPPHAARHAAPPSVGHGAALVWLLFVLAVGASCSGDLTRPTGPGVRGASRRHAPLVPAFSLAPGIGGFFAMPADGNQIAEVPLTATGIFVPDGLPARVVIGGAITREPTPGLRFFCSTDEWREACATRWADYVSDQPIPPAGLFEYYARAVASWGGAEPGNLIGSSELYLTGPGGGELYVGRAGWECFYELNVKNPDGTMKYPYDFGPCHTFGGGYEVVVQADDGGGLLALSVSQSQLPAGGGSVSFDLTTSDGSTPTDVFWQFVDDPPAQPAPVAAPQLRASAAVTAAARGEVFTPDSAGRLVPGRPIQGGLMLIRRTALPSGAVSRPKASDPRVAVRPGAAAAPATDACTELMSCAVTITSTGAMTARATVGGRQLSASVRVTVGAGGGAPALRLSCPLSVERGQLAVCTASADPLPATLAVTGWTFRPDDDHLQIIERQAGVNEQGWSGKMATSGTVAVTATLDGGRIERSSHITVTDRPPLIVGFTAPAPSDDDDMSERPYGAAEEEGLFHIAHIHAGAHNIRLQGNVEVIADGPNVGLAYFTANPYEPSWAVHINFSQLQPNSELGRLQRESSPAFESTVSCLRSQLPDLVGPIAEHEGTTMHPKSHAGRYASKFNELAGPIVERLVAQQDLVGAVDAALAPVIQAADEESRKADGDFRPVLCRLTLFPRPR